VSGGWPEVISDDRLDVDYDLLGAGEGHHEVLLVDVAPAGEEAVGGQEEEEVLPFKSQVVLVEHLQTPSCEGLWQIFFLSSSTAVFVNNLLLSTVLRH